MKLFKYMIMIVLNFLIWVSSAADLDLNPESMRTQVHEMLQTPDFQKKMKVMFGEDAINKAVGKAKEALSESGSQLTIENLKQKMEEGLKKLKKPILDEVIVSDSSLGHIDADDINKKKATFLEKMDQMNDPFAKKEAVELARHPALSAEIKQMLKDSNFQARFHKLHDLPDREQLRTELLKIPVLRDASKNSGL